MKQVSLCVLKINAFVELFRLQAILDELRREKEEHQSKCMEYEKELKLLKSSKTVFQHAEEKSSKKPDQILSPQSKSMNQTKANSEDTTSQNFKLNRHEKTKCHICNQPPFGLMV
jgi:hypothetical protein